MCGCLRPGSAEERIVEGKSTLGVSGVPRDFQCIMDVFSLQPGVWRGKSLGNAAVKRNQRQSHTPQLPIDTEDFCYT